MKKKVYAKCCCCKDRLRGNPAPCGYVYVCGTGENKRAEMPCLEHEKFFTAWLKLSLRESQKYSPKLTKVEVKKAKKKGDTIKVKKNEPEALYHMIFKHGPQTYHFCTIAVNKEEAKEKIIEKQKACFDSDFPKLIREIDIHKVTAGVLKVYE